MRAMAERKDLTVTKIFTTRPDDCSHSNVGAAAAWMNVKC